MSEIITITNIEKTANSQYSVGFTSNFVLVDLFYEISLDGSTWGTPIELVQLTSPQTITVANAVNFNLRLSANYTAPPPLNDSVYTSQYSDVYGIAQVYTSQYNQEYQ